MGADLSCEVWFYHLERTALDQALPDLLERTLAKGWKALVRTSSPERLEHLDSWLWSYRDDSFLAHGLASEPDAERQPIVISRELSNPNGADALFLIDGAEPGELGGFVRCMVLFDGRDEAALTHARGRWKTMKEAGYPVSYWKQGERGWEKAA